MSTTPNAPRAVITASFVVILVLAGILWAATVANAITIRSSDAAGNAMSQAYGVLMAIALFVILAILVVFAAVRGGLPGWMRVAALVLVPASGAATIGAIEALSQGREWPVKSPIVIPALAPALIILLAFWAYLPSFRGAAPASAIGAVTLGGLALLSIAPWPLLRELRARHA